MSTQHSALSTQHSALSTVPYTHWQCPIRSSALYSRLILRYHSLYVPADVEGDPHPLLAADGTRAYFVDNYLVPNTNLVLPTHLISFQYTASEPDSNAGPGAAHTRNAHTYAHSLQCQRTLTAMSAQCQRNVSAMSAQCHRNVTAMSPHTHCHHSLHTNHLQGAVGAGSPSKGTTAGQCFRCNSALAAVFCTDCNRPYCNRCSAQVTAAPASLLTQPSARGQVCEPSGHERVALDLMPAIVDCCQVRTHSASATYTLCHAHTLPRTHC